ncbi:phosphoglycerol transferase MdoB-like AlkP superfamily enzyme [Marinilabilia salmonicolor]|jgi:phosphoglycerol transferase MdoB-like AlkP superfamily enzyme|uniref:LTA synthase family protein n=1 Tax=Marinilabilia salmonicolor TaxID=989 RepID=UPI000D06390F|nr:LTA synthase family protein [Marinilabilia salmonicolor]PRZ01396.1 phosphoglycerol transferase MdoB-like AlkP superfamily enzyme [Marinilabilia salmonicolor]
MKRFLYTFLKVWLFWLLFFAFFRAVFIVVNYGYADNTSLLTILASFGPGLRMDLSFSGYLMLLTAVIQVASLLIQRKFCSNCILWMHYILIPLFAGLLLGDINLFRYWGGHLNSEAVSFLGTPGIILNSIHWSEVLVFFVVLAGVCWGLIVLFRKFVVQKPFVAVFEWRLTAINAGVTLFLAALMIVPIRGSFGVAPINTGAAYFSNSLFANNAAVNPLWNLAYSMKRSGIEEGQYRFVSEDVAEEQFADLMQQSGEFEPLLNTRQPDIVVVLLEGFSAQAIESLGGAPITKNLEKLKKEGVFFDNIFATSFRSDYGMVGVMAGYPGIPGYSIMQYPDKSRKLSFIPQKLKNAGYNDLNFIYGGDMAFKNLKSLITLAGFDDVVDIDDFPVENRGQKWGVHDEFTFRKFASMIEESESPAFNFMFTLSSHEPFDVPMERVYENDYFNSVHYTDSCLGEFVDEMKEKNLWDNSLIVLIADHGVTGPEKLGYTDARRYRIPMLWTGGALAVRDTVINTYGSQADLAATLLSQLGIETGDFEFSKNILDKDTRGFAFMHYPDGFGLVSPNQFQVFDKSNFTPLVLDGARNEVDSLKAKIFMQRVATDFKERINNGKK